MSPLLEIVIYLGAAVLAVPLARWLRLGAVLGFLVAGMVIGPAGLGLIGDVESRLHFAEVGVVLLLFVIGLELQPKRLWALRKTVFGIGSVQVLATGLVLAPIGLWLGLDVPTAYLIGLTLALSSTAFALQSLAERKQLTTRYGRVAFGILLFQDLAVVPLLALIPLLGAAVAPDTGLQRWWSIAEVVLVLALIILGGHFVLRHVLRLVAATGIREAFTALALLLVIGTALLAEHVGLSMALGAFLAGVLLADSEYRHALEADIEPFKGLLLGLFFIAVGMSVNLGLLTAQPLQVLSLVVVLVAGKAGVLFALGKRAGLDNEGARNLAVAISQGGEFAFVVLGVVVTQNLVGRDIAELLIVVVTLSMMTTPLLFALQDLAASRVRSTSTRDYDRPAVADNQVIIAGFGRFGQIVARILRARKISFTALDSSPEHVDFVRKYGNRVYYGDASRIDLLRAARADQAQILVLAIDDMDASLRTARTVIDQFPNLKIYARAHNRKHAYLLMDLGVDIIRRETFESSLDMARQVLMGLGLGKSESERLVDTFKRHDVQHLHAHRHLHDDEERMAQVVMEGMQELEALFEQDAVAALDDRPPG